MGTRGGEGSESARARKGTGARDFFCFPSGTERERTRERARARETASPSESDRWCCYIHGMADGWVGIDNRTRESESEREQRRAYGRQRVVEREGDEEQNEERTEHEQTTTTALPLGLSHT